MTSKEQEIREQAVASIDRHLDISIERARATAKLPFFSNEEESKDYVERETAWREKLRARIHEIAPKVTGYDELNEAFTIRKELFNESRRLYMKKGYDYSLKMSAEADLRFETLCSEHQVASAFMQALWYDTPWFFEDRLNRAVRAYDLHIVK